MKLLKFFHYDNYLSASTSPLLVLNNTFLQLLFGSTEQMEPDREHHSCFNLSVRHQHFLNINLLAVEQAAHWQLQLTNLLVKHIGALLSNSTLSFGCFWVHHPRGARARAQNVADFAKDSRASGCGRGSFRLIQVIESKTHKVGGGVDHWQQELLFKVCAGAVGALAGADELPPCHLKATVTCLSKLTAYIFTWKQSRGSTIEEVVTLLTRTAIIALGHSSEL